MLVHHQALSEPFFILATIYSKRFSDFSTAGRDKYRYNGNSGMNQVFHPTSYSQLSAVGDQKLDLLTAPSGLAAQSLTKRCCLNLIWQHYLLSYGRRPRDPSIRRTWEELVSSVQVE